MPHRAGHTTIEMSSHRPSQPSHHALGGHEHPLAHRTPLAGAHAPHDRGNHHNGNHGLHAGDAAAGISHLPLPSRGHSPRRSPSPHTNGSPRDGVSPSASSTSVNNPEITTDDHLPLLSRPRRALPAGAEDALRSPLSLNINTDVPADKSQPLLETDTTKPVPPLAGPEIDDMDDNTPTTAEIQPGVDDGFFSSADGTNNNSGDGNQDDDKKEGDDEGAPEFPLLGIDRVDKPKGEEDGEKTWTEGDEADGNGYNDIFGSPNGLAPRFGADTPFPYAPEFAPGAQPRIIPDVNVYQQKKNLAQGMMDLALLSANANQLRYVLEAEFHPYFYPSLIFICASLILQIGVGVGLIVNSTYNVKEHDDICKADRINNFTVIGIFLITVVNVFIASFGVGQMPGSTSATGGSNKS